MIDINTFYLSSGDVELRRIYAGDLLALYEVYSDPEVMRFASDPPFTSVEMMHQFFTSVEQGYQTGAYYELAIVYQQDKVIGTCSLHSINWPQQRAEIGFLLNRHYWRRGIMSEVLRIFLHYCFGELAINVLEAEIDEKNIASRKLVTQMGFRPVAGEALKFCRCSEWEMPFS